MHLIKMLFVCLQRINKNIVMGANGTKEEQRIGILHNKYGYWISNEGTKQNPSYHVWVPDITHSKCDSAYSDITLAVARCNFLARNKSKIIK